MKIIIDQYIKAYNEFDVDKMVRNIHPDVEFKNIANGEVNMHIQGLETFKKQVKDSTKLLKKREMTITEQAIEGDVVKIK